MTSQRSRSFGAAAAAYERYRPEYPDLVVRLIEDYADRPIRSALELGAGTGKATRIFARQGVRVIASEPDDAMLAELRERVTGVETVAATLEELPPIGPFDLVFVAAALHWTEAVGRWDRISALLVSGRVFANFGGAPELADPALAEAARAAQLPWLVDDLPAGTIDVSDDGMHWPATELVRDGRFTDIRETVIEQRLELAQEDWLGYLSTVSAYLVLGENDRAAVLAAVAEVLPEVVEVRADLTVHLARRV
jgi:SAM-dependent methyltransferase